MADDLRHSEMKTFKIEFNIKEEYENFIKRIKKIKELNVIATKPQKNQVKIEINDAHINNLINIVSDYDLKFISEIKFTLEDYFMNFYDRNINTEGGA